MTGEKTSLYFTEAVIPIVRMWKSRGWGPQDLVNTAVVLFHKADAADREAARAIANLGSSVNPADVATDRAVQKRILAIIRTLEASVTETPPARPSRTAKAR